MAERKRGLTADERFAELRRDQARLRRERMLRELGGATWHSMVKIVPVLFRFQGTTAVRILRAEPAQIIEALRDDAVFAVDTAMRLAHGAGFLAGGVDLRNEQARGRGRARARPTCGTPSCSSRGAGST